MCPPNESSASEQPTRRNRRSVRLHRDGYGDEGYGQSDMQGRVGVQLPPFENSRQDHEQNRAHAQQLSQFRPMVVDQYRIYSSKVSGSVQQHQQEEQAPMPT